MKWEGIAHFPGGAAQFGTEGAVKWTELLKPELVITLFDVWTFPQDFGDQIKFHGADWMPIVPIDCEPIHEFTLRVLNSASYVCAMSRFGEKLLRNQGFFPKYLPHGVDTNIFKPGASDKALIQAKDKFVVGCVAANLEKFDRKGLYPTIRAFAKFQKKHKDSVFYFHGELTRAEDGIDLEWIAHELGIKVHTVDRWHRWAFLESEELATLYNTFDVFMLLTRGEGFCVPLIEAQACGTPVIVTDYTAPQDLVGAGWKIPIVDRIPTLIRGYWGEPDVDKGVEALEEAYQMWKDGKDMKQQARDFALDYDFKTVTQKYLVPILKEIENDHVKMRGLVRGRKSKRRRRRKRRGSKM
jgi:glycosyltransferase involved in cell wall biosynthesis